MHLRCARRPRRLAILTLTALAVTAAPAVAAPPDQVGDAVDLGVTWIRSQQDPTTGELAGFGGDWSVTALAAAGVDVADVKTSGGPSAQDFYLGLWTTGGDDPFANWIAPSDPDDPFGRPATDYARALLLAHAAGLGPTRLSADQNLLAQMAGLYNGRPAVADPPGSAPTEGTFGAPGLFNGTVFGLLALARTDAPPALIDKVVTAVRANQHDDGGWTFQRVTNAATRARASDIDMTGASIGALCDAGVPPSDPDVQEGAAFLQSKVDPASGGFQHMFGINADSAAWAIQGLNACGIDPQGPGWAPGGKSPVDFLLALQRTSGPNAGSFKYMANEDDAGFPSLYSSQNAVRALAGAGMTADPVTVRPAPAVAAGTVVPQALVVDSGQDVRFCRVYAPLGSTVLALLQKAQSAAQPAGCVGGMTFGEGQVLALNGVSGGTPAERWLAHVGGSAAAPAGPQTVGLGELVTLELGPHAGPVARPKGTTSGSMPPAGEPAAPRPDALTARLRTRTQRISRKGRIAVRVACPQSATSGCRVTLLARATFRLPGQRKARPRDVAHGSLTLAAGQARTLHLRLGAALRRDLQRHSRRTIRLRAFTRTGDGAVYVHRQTVIVRGQLP